MVGNRYPINRTIYEAKQISRHSAVASEGRSVYDSLKRRNLVNVYSSSRLSSRAGSSKYRVARFLGIIMIFRVRNKLMRAGFDRLGVCQSSAIIHHDRCAKDISFVYTMPIIRNRDTPRPGKQAEIRRVGGEKTSQNRQKNFTTHSR